MLARLSSFKYRRNLASFCKCNVAPTFIGQSVLHYEIRQKNTHKYHGILAFYVRNFILGQTQMGCFSYWRSEEVVTRSEYLTSGKDFGSISNVNPKLVERRKTEMILAVLAKELTFHHSATTRAKSTICCMAPDYKVVTSEWRLISVTG